VKLKLLYYPRFEKYAPTPYLQTIMPVYLPTAIAGNHNTLLTLGNAGEIMAWFYPSKDHAQNIHQCLLAVYHGAPFHGHLSWTYEDLWERHQYYDGDSNIPVTELTSHALCLRIRLTDVVPDEGAVLLRRIEVENIGTAPVSASVFHYGDWNLGGIRMGNAVRYDRAANALVQGHHDLSLAIGGDALETWQCGKAGLQWGSNALHDLNDGALNRQDLEIGDVNWSFGFAFELAGCSKLERTAVFALDRTEAGALATMQAARDLDFQAASENRRAADAAILAPGLQALKATGGLDALPADLLAAYKRSLLCLPLLCGEEGVAVAAPEFDPEFIACGGYGYHWPRDGGEYVSGLLDAGYSEFATKFFGWCARNQDESGLWHQRYFLNGQPGPNWCLPPDMLQIDQVGAVLWALGKTLSLHSDAFELTEDVKTMTRMAADYLESRLTEYDVHGNAFDTWETFVGSFTYSNAAIYAAFKTAHVVLGEQKYADAARRVKEGVLAHFVRDEEYPYLVRGFDSHGNEDWTVDSASLGAIEPFGLLDLNNDRELAIAEGTLRAVTERLDVDWEGGRAIRRFEGDAYVGGVPACVNTLWMARCCLHLANRLDEIGRSSDARQLTQRAKVYLQTVLHRATPTGLLPELMNGPEGQRWWAAPHGWAMSSFVSGTLSLARRMAQ
jgi:oligosaccharide amylase